MASQPLHSIPHVNIFHTGEFGDGIAYDEAYLDKLIENTPYSVPIVIDHINEGPAFGWASRFTRENGKLYADLSKIPDAFYQQLTDYAYQNRSLGWWHSDDPSIMHVSFLGARNPMLPDLDPILSFSRKDGTVKHFDLADLEPINFSHSKEEIKTVSPKKSNTKQESNPMEETKIDPKVAELEAKLKEAEKAKDELAAQFSAFQAEAQRAEAEADFEKVFSAHESEWTSDKDLLKEIYTSVSGVKSFSASENSVQDLVLKLMSSRKPSHIFSSVIKQKSFDAGDTKPDTNKIALHEKVQTYAKEHGIEFRDAALAVASQS